MFFCGKVKNHELGTSFLYTQLMILMVKLVSSTSLLHVDVIHNATRSPVNSVKLKNMKMAIQQIFSKHGNVQILGNYTKKSKLH
jgi:hypothetical protein